MLLHHTHNLVTSNRDHWKSLPTTRTAHATEETSGVDKTVEDPVPMLGAVRDEFETPARLVVLVEAALAPVAENCALGLRRKLKLEPFSILSHLSKAPT